MVYVSFTTLEPKYGVLVPFCKQDIRPGYMGFHKSGFFLSLLAVYVISPKHKNPAQAILNVALILKSLSDFVGVAT